VGWRSATNGHHGDRTPTPTPFSPEYLLA